MANRAVPSWAPIGRCASARRVLPDCNACLGQAGQIAFASASSNCFTTCCMLPMRQHRHSLKEYPGDPQKPGLGLCKLLLTSTALP